MNPSISRFTTAKADSKPIEEPFTAPVIKGDADYDFLTILQALADNRTDSGISHYHSFSLWGEGHASYEHGGTTCLHIGYTPETADDVSAVLDDANLFYYRIPIVDKRSDAVLFVFPSSDRFDHVETTRATAVLAHGIGVKGVIKSTYYSTYFFRFQDGAKVTQGGSDILSNDVIHDNHGLFVRMADWMAK